MVLMGFYCYSYTIVISVRHDGKKFACGMCPIVVFCVTNIGCVFCEDKKVIILFAQIRLTLDCSLNK